uniref:Protein kinase domain-containing protein n=1 Tax=Elaeophora elaphi TaxID=1147741 RepID=A0A0R3RZW7_9BILA
MEMIHGLIDDSECNVEEVIQRVSSSHNTSISQSEENANRSTSALALSGTSATAAALIQKKSHACGTVVSHAPLEVSHSAATSKKTVPYTATTNVWAQRAAQRQNQKIVSAIGSEKKQKMSSGATEQENPNTDQALQLKTSGILHPPQEISAADMAVLQIGVEVTRKFILLAWDYLFSIFQDETQKRGVKEFCRAPGHARPTSASASSPSVSPIGLKSPIHVGPGSVVVASSIGTAVSADTVTDVKPGAELFEALVVVSFFRHKIIGIHLCTKSVTERTLQPLLGTAKSNLDVVKPSSIDQKLFSPLDSTRPSIISPSIANIWDDNIVDDKPWVVTAPLARVQFEDFARNINMQISSSAKPTRDYSNSGTTADHVVDLAKNIASLRTSEDRPVSATSNEAVARRTFLGENMPSFDLNVPFSSRDPVDWGNAGPFPTDTFARWRNAQLDSAPITGSTEEIDSSSWIDQASVAARLASTRQEPLPFPPTTSYAVPGNSGHVASSFGTDVANVNLNQQQQSTQAWNRIHFQQAAQAASNEYENLTNLLSSYRPAASSQHQPVPSQQQHLPQSIMPMGNINYNAAPTAVGPTGFRIPAPRSQIANTSIPPPPFFNSQIPPPSSMSHRGGIPVTQSAANTAWPSIHFAGQAQTNTVTENTQFPQYPNTTRGNWSYNW